MDVEAIRSTAEIIAGMRPAQSRREPRRSAKWREIEVLKEKRALILEVASLLPGHATEIEAIAWLDGNCPWWRDGPTPTATPLVVEVTDDDE